MDDIKYGGNKPPWMEELENHIRKEIDLGSKEAMELNGYVVVAKEIDGKKYVVKEYKDGRIETIKEIEKNFPPITGGVMVTKITPAINPLLNLKF